MVPAARNCGPARFRFVGFDAARPVVGLSIEPDPARSGHPARLEIRATLDFLAEALPVRVVESLDHDAPLCDEDLERLSVEFKARIERCLQRCRVHRVVVLELVAIDGATTVVKGAAGFEPAVDQFVLAMRRSLRVSERETTVESVEPSPQAIRLVAETGGAVMVVVLGIEAARLSAAAKSGDLIELRESLRRNVEELCARLSSS